MNRNYTGVKTGDRVVVVLARSHGEGQVLEGDTGTVTQVRHQCRVQMDHLAEPVWLDARRLQVIRETKEGA